MPLEEPAAAGGRRSACSVDQELERKDST